MNSVLCSLMVMVGFASADKVWYQSEVNGLSFEGMSKLTDFEWSKSIYHMEVDEYLEDHLLVAIGSGLYTLNMKALTIDSVVGHRLTTGYANGYKDSNRFERITDFAQHNSTSVLVVDSGNRAIRAASRIHYNTSDVVGSKNCTESVTGSFSSACFASLKVIERFSADTYYVLDNGMRRMDMTERLIEQVIPYIPAYFMAIHRSAGIIYLMHRSFDMYGPQTGHKILLTNLGELGNDGNDSTGTLGVIQDMLVDANSSFLLIADVNRLRVFNLITNALSSICIRSPLSGNDNDDGCAPITARALCRWNMTHVLVATSSGIQVLALQRRYTTLVQLQKTTDGEEQDTTPNSLIIAAEQNITTVSRLKYKSKAVQTTAIVIAIIAGLLAIVAGMAVYRRRRLLPSIQLRAHIEKESDNKQDQPHVQENNKTRLATSKNSEEPKPVKQPKEIRSNSPSEKNSRKSKE